MRKELKIGLFGGSFDPVHNAHLKLAQAAMKELGLGKVIFIPAKYPPHKLGKKLAPAARRVRMLSAALKGCPHFTISRLELNKNRPAYTYQTAAVFKKMFPKAKLYFIIGTDSFVELNTWKNIDKLLETIQFVSGKRPGVKPKRRAPYADRVKMLKAKLPAVSSTQVRKLASEGKTLKGLVPAAVEKIINNCGLYHANN